MTVQDQRLPHTARHSGNATRRPTLVDEKVGANLKRLRRRSKISQVTLGRMVGLSFKQIRKYESGENRISASILYLLATALDVSISAFYDGLPQVTEFRKLPLEAEADALRGLYDQIAEPQERSAFLRMVKEISESGLYS